MKLSRKSWIILVIVLLAIGGISYFALRKKAVTYETARVDRGPVIETVSVTGSIASKTKINLQPESGGQVAKIFVKEGDDVKAGDSLVQLDKSDAASRVASQQAIVDVALAQLRQMQAGSTPEELNVAKAAVDTAQAQYNAAVSAKSDAEKSLQNARQNHDNAAARADSSLQSRVETFLVDYDQANYVAGDAVNRLTTQLFTYNDLLSFITSSSQAVTDAQSTRVAAKAALPNLQAKVSQAKTGGTTDAVIAAYGEVMAALNTVNDHVNADAAVLNFSSNLSAATQSAYQLNVNTAQTSINAITQKLTSDMTGLDLQKRQNAADNTAADIAVSTAEAALSNATHAIDTANSNLEQARAAYDLKKAGTRKETVDAQRAQVDAQRATLASLQNALEKRTIIASIDGIVVDIPVVVGQTVTPAQAVVSIMTKGKFEIVANISEIDIAKVKVNDSVAITLDAFPGGDKWTGKVISIQPAEKVVEGVVFYETKIVFDNEDTRLRSGMTANLDVETARNDDALRMPLRALKEKSGRKFVQVMRAGKPVEVDVTTGLQSNDFVEIKSGLSVGDEVVVSSTAK